MLKMQDFRLIDSNYPLGKASALVRQLTWQDFKMFKWLDSGVCSYFTFGMTYDELYKVQFVRHPIKLLCRTLCRTLLGASIVIHFSSISSRGENVSEKYES